MAITLIPLKGLEDSNIPKACYKALSFFISKHNKLHKEKQLMTNSNKTQYSMAQRVEHHLAPNTITSKQCLTPWGHSSRPLIFGQCFPRVLSGFTNNISDLNIETLLFVRFPKLTNGNKDSINRILNLTFAPRWKFVFLQSSPKN